MLLLEELDDSYTGISVLALNRPDVVTSQGGSVRERLPDLSFPASSFHPPQSMRDVLKWGTVTESLFRSSEAVPTAANSRVVTAGQNGCRHRTWK